jgi:hypothetical protein
MCRILTLHGVAAIDVNKHALDVSNISFSRPTLAMNIFVVGFQNLTTLPLSLQKRLTDKVLS